MPKEEHGLWNEAELGNLWKSSDTEMSLSFILFPVVPTLMQEHPLMGHLDLASLISSFGKALSKENWMNSAE